MFQGRLRQADKLQGPAVPNILKGQGPAVPTWINGAGPIVQRAGGAKHFVQGPAVPIWINGQAGDAKLIVKGQGPAVPDWLYRQGPAVLCPKDKLPRAMCAKIIRTNCPEPAVLKTKRSGRDAGQRSTNTHTHTHTSASSISKALPTFRYHGDFA